MKTPNQPAEPCATDCPVRRAAQVLDGKWTLLILRDLMAGTRRYSALQRSLEGISPRLLAARLRELEREGLVHREVFPTLPPTTAYTLTALGTRLEPVVQALAAFGQQLFQHDAGTVRNTPPAANAPTESNITRVRSGLRI